jgi:hypothetical protein
MLDHAHEESVYVASVFCIGYQQFIGNFNSSLQLLLWTMIMWYLQMEIWY